LSYRSSFLPVFSHRRRKLRDCLSRNAKIAFHARLESPRRASLGTHTHIHTHDSRHPQAIFFARAHIARHPSRARVLVPQLPSPDYFYLCKQNGRRVLSMLVRIPPALMDNIYEGREPGNGERAQGVTVPAGCLTFRAISFRSLFDRLTFSLIGVAGAMCSYQHGRVANLFPYRAFSRLLVSRCTFRFPRAASVRERKREREYLPIGESSSLLGRNGRCAAFPWNFYRG
jgi:hypothetical protein